MNRGQLNGFVINGQIADPVVRVRVDAKGYARGRAQGRVLAYGVVAATGCAHQAGILGRVEAQLSVQAMARAAVSGVLGRLDVHALLQSTGRAIIEVTLPPVHGRAKSKAVAKIGLKAHAEVRGTVSTTGKAKGQAAGRLLRRAPIAAKPRAKVNANGVVYARRWLRSPVQSNTQAFIVSRSRIDARLATITKAKAYVVAKGHAMRRSPTAAHAIALIDIDFAVHKRLPFDEQAPEYRTFIVPAGQFIFTVTE